jgi:hypothetical protein
MLKREDEQLYPCLCNDQTYSRDHTRRRAECETGKCKCFFLCAGRSWKCTGMFQIEVKTWFGWRRRGDAGKPDRVLLSIIPEL